MFRTEAKFLVRRVKILDTPRLSSLSLPISTLVFSPFPLETFANSYLSPETFSDGNERHSILDGDSRLSPRRHFESKKKKERKKKKGGRISKRGCTSTKYAWQMAAAIQHLLLQSIISRQETINSETASSRSRGSVRKNFLSNLCAPQSVPKQAVIRADDNACL